jgi:putative transposase
MRNLVILFVHVTATFARLLGPGGIRSVVAESVLVKQQLLILNRFRHRSPIYSLQIASSPACVLSSFVPPA